jgi:hypothetical protein
MEGTELIALRTRALLVFDVLPPPPPPPVRTSWKRLVVMLAASLVISTAAVVWLDKLADTKTAAVEEAPPVQSASIEDRAPPPDVDVAGSFETIAAADASERSKEPAVVQPAPEPEAMLPRFLSWAAANDMSVPMENATAPKARPSKDAQAKMSARDLELEREAAADKKWEERHARRSAAARKTVHRATQRAQKPQQPAPTASTAPPGVPQVLDFWRGG